MVYHTEIKDRQFFVDILRLSAYSYTAALRVLEAHGSPGTEPAHMSFVAIRARALGLGQFSIWLNALAEAPRDDSFRVADNSSRTRPRNG